MKEVFPIQRSILSAKALRSYVEQEYDLGQTMDCNLINTSLNDTYALRTYENKRYILRVYRTGTRSLTNVMYEIEVLRHLDKKKVPVAAALRRKDNDYVGIIEAPEGQRYVCLFKHAPGKEPTYEDEGQAIQYGMAEASVHAATDDFMSKEDRPILGIENLIDTPLRSIQPLLAHRSQDWDYLLELACRIRDKLAALPLSSLDYGFCHGDLHGWNANFDADGTVTFYDFDSSGPGWRAYDLATFLWAAMLRRKEDERWPLFVQGYKERREIHEVDWRAVPFFIGVRHFWYMGYHADESRDLAFGWLNDEYYNREIGFIRLWDSKVLKDKNAG